MLFMDIYTLRLRFQGFPIRKPLPLPVTGNFHNGQTMCHSDINSAKTCRISRTKACLGYILVKLLALTRITSPGKFLINTRSDPPPPSIVYRNLPVRTPWILVNFPYYPTCFSSIFTNFLVVQSKFVNGC